MSELNQDQKDLINSVKFATEFLKVVRGFKLDQERIDSLPIDIKEHLANQHLNEMIKDNNLEPEMLLCNDNQELTTIWNILRTFTSTQINNSNIGRNLYFISQE